MPVYHSFIVASPSEAAEISNLPFPTEWKLVTEPDPSFRHWTDSSGNLSVTLENPSVPEIEHWEGNGIRCHELLIECANVDIAQNVASLIRIGTILGYPDLTRAPRPETPVQKQDDQEMLFLAKPFSKWFKSTETALYGSSVACSAWGDSRKCYAIEKYRLSLSLDSFTPHSAAPVYGKVFETAFPEYSYHVDAGFAALSAFSVVEELGLEVRSSQKKKRWQDNEKGIWNPKVLEDVESRLTDHNVDLQDPFVWLYRGAPSPLEAEISPRLGNPTSYADGEIVRDVSLTIPEALHKSSYIRNFVVAHKFSDLVSSLGPYDVHNMQLLARRLILSSLGLFKVG